MKILTGYLQREILTATLLLFVGLVLLFGFFDLINELGDIGKQGRTLTGMFLYVALRLPTRCYELAPVSALIGTLFALSQLVASSEFTVMRGSGVSLWQVSRVILRVAIPIAVLAFVIGEWLAPPSERLAQEVKNISRNRGDLIAQQFSSGFWFKEDNAYVNIRAATSSHVLRDIYIYEFNGQHQLLSIKTAKSGIYSQERGAWKLENVRITNFASDNQAEVIREPVYEWRSVLRPSLLTVFQTPPEQLELQTLFTNIEVLRKSAQDTSRFEVALWVKLAYPINIFVMMLLALPFSQFQRRQGGVGFRLFAGAIIGLTFFLVGRLFSYIGTLNNWSPLLSAFTPTVLFLVLLVTMLRRQERR